MSKRGKDINPCIQKGRLAGRLSGGRRYEFGSNQVYVSTCECKESMVSLSAKAEVRLCYAMRFHRDQVAVVPAPQGKRTSESDLVVVPCQETFRYEDSPGTKLFRRHTEQAQQKQTAFFGCQALEEDLVRDGFIRYEPTGFLGRKRDVVQETAHQQGAWWNPDNYDTNFDQSSARENAGRADWLTDDPWEDRVGEDVALQKKQREIRRAFRKFLSFLTAAQREAIEMVYLKNDERVKKVQVARRLGISVETLRDRLDQAIKKLEAAFPQYKRAKRKRKLNLSSDLLVGGFYRRSEGVKRREVRVGKA